MALLRPITLRLKCEPEAKTVFNQMTQHEAQALTMLTH